MRHVDVETIVSSSTCSQKSPLRNFAPYSKTFVIQFFFFTFSCLSMSHVRVGDIEQILILCSDRVPEIDYAGQMELSHLKYIQIFQIFVFQYIRNVLLNRAVKRGVFTGKNSSCFTYVSHHCQVKVSVWKTASKLF